MPIDPRIPLMGGAPEAPRLVDKVGQFMNIKDMMQRQEINSMALQNERLKMYQLEQLMRDESVALEVLGQYGGDINQAKDPLIRAIGPRALPILEKMAKTDEAIASLNTETAKALKERLSIVGDSIDGIESLPQEQRSAAYAQMMTQFEQMGILTPEMKQSIPLQYPGSEMLAGFGDYLGRLKKQVELKVAETLQKKADVDLEKSRLDLESSRRTMPGESGLTPYQDRDLKMREGDVTEPELAFRAANGDESAQRALEIIQRQRVAIEKAKAEAGLGGGGMDVAAATVDPNSASILSQTGLSIPAFFVLTGRAPQLPRDRATRNKAMREAEQWANSRGVDISTMASQYQSYNSVLESNIDRMNRTKIMEDELIGTVENIREVAKGADFGRLRAANVAKVFAGQEVNDNLTQQYKMHLFQLRNELAAYGAATQGRSGNNITLADMKEAEETIMNGIAAGSVDGLERAVKNSTTKMEEVMKRSVHTARKAVWELFGVGENYGKGGKGKPASKPKSDPLGIF